MGWVGSPTTGTNSLTVPLQIRKPHPSLSPLALAQLIPHILTHVLVCVGLCREGCYVGWSRLWVVAGGAGREEISTCVHSPLGQVGRR